MLILLLAGLGLAADPPRLVLDLTTSPENPRNTEGSFLRLKNGDLLYAYSKFTGGTSDHATGHIAMRLSRDGGRTWTSDDQTLAANESGLNAMSVSFLRLKSGEIALFVINKNSMRDSRPVMRLSRDEGKTWSEAIATIPEAGYFVLNNDRVVQLKNGRILLPVALHHNESDDPKQFNNHGVAMVYLSDNKGKSWRRSKTVLENPGNRDGFQEPGIVALKDGRLLMFLRTSRGSQYFPTPRTTATPGHRRNRLPCNRRFRRPRSNESQRPAICWQSGTITHRALPTGARRSPLPSRQTTGAVGARRRALKTIPKAGTVTPPSSSSTIVFCSAMSRAGPVEPQGSAGPW